MYAGHPISIEDIPPVQRIAVHRDGHGDGQLVRDDTHAVAADGALAAHGLDRHVAGVAVIGDGDAFDLLAVHLQDNGPHIFLNGHVFSLCVG